MPPSKRRRGAQPGNRNAQTHGFYTERPRPENLDLGYVYKGMQDEITVIRLYLHRLAELGQYTEDLPALLTVIRGLHLATASLARLTRLHDQLATLHEGERSLRMLGVAISNVMEEHGWPRDPSAQKPPPLNPPKPPAAAPTPPGQPALPNPPPQNPAGAAPEPHQASFELPDPPGHDHSF